MSRVARKHSAFIFTMGNRGPKAKEKRALKSVALRRAMEFSGFTEEKIAELGVPVLFLKLHTVTQVTSSKVNDLQR